MIRQAYHEHIDYVPLVKNAYRLWANSNSRRRGNSITRPDCSSPHRQRGRPSPAPSSPPGCTICRTSLHRATISLRGFRVFCSPRGSRCFSKPKPVICWSMTASAFRLWRVHGAQLHADETVTQWQADRTGVVVETNRCRYTADRLVIAAGPWARFSRRSTSSAEGRPQAVVSGFRFAMRAVRCARREPVTSTTCPGASFTVSIAATDARSRWPTTPAAMTSPTH